MSRGPGRVQRAIMKALTEDNEAIQGSVHTLAKIVYDLGDRQHPEEKHMNAVNRALKGMLPWLDENGWSLERDTLKRLGVDKWTRNGRAATGSTKKIIHRQRQLITMKAQMGNRPATQYIKDETHDGEKFIEDVEAQGAYDVRVQILMEVDRLLKSCPIKLRHVGRLKSTILQMHREDQGNEVEITAPASEPESAYERAVRRSQAKTKA